jgi:hypothetical protein
MAVECGLVAYIPDAATDTLEDSVLWRLKSYGGDFDFCVFKLVSCISGTVSPVRYSYSILHHVDFHD